LKIVIAPDSFKESLSAREVAGIIEKGIKRVLPRARCVKVPMADGGGGTVEAMAAAAGGEKISVVCPGPLGDPVTAEFLALPGGKTVLIESARSCGLTLVAERRDILHSDTSGLGIQIRSALDRRPETIQIGLGGSATNDWGAGMAAALGLRFLDARGRVLRPTPAGLAGLRTIDPSGFDARLRAVRHEALTDVDNPLLGPSGAAAIFGPQKGADADAVRILEETGERFADAVESSLGRRFRDRPGAGAAGGLGFGVLAFLGAEIRPGIEAMIEAAGLKAKARAADLIITGEGRLDAQSRRGKTAAGIARLARETKCPCVAFCGSIDGPVTDYVPDPFAAAYEIRPEAASLADAISRAAYLLEIIARRSAGDIRKLV